MTAPPKLTASLPGWNDHGREAAVMERHRGLSPDYEEGFALQGRGNGSASRAGEQGLTWIKHQASARRQSASLRLPRALRAITMLA